MCCQNSLEADFRPRKKKMNEIKKEREREREAEERNDKTRNKRIINNIAAI